MFSPSGATAIVLAAGSGQRLGGWVPKQFLELAGKPLFCHCLDVFESSPAIGSVVLVAPSVPFDWQGRRYSKVRAVVVGGQTRSQSVELGLAALPEGTEVVLVHDAARPLVNVDLIESLIQALAPPFDGAVPGVPLEDAIKKVGADGEIQAGLSRDRVWRVQTPQAFFRQPLEISLRKARRLCPDPPDCSQMLTEAGYRVRMVAGDRLNLKVTRPADLRLAELFLQERARRAGGEGL